MSFLVNALSSLWNSLLGSLGLLDKEGNLLLLGLDNAGKTTLLHKLSCGDLRPFPPTDRPRRDSFKASPGLSFQAWDLGGHEAVRHLWEDYVSEDISAVLFLLDSSDPERFEEAGYELDALIGEKVLEGIPIAILLNKTDLETSEPDEAILKAIEYDRLRDAHGGPDNMRHFRISVLNGEGYHDAFKWIADNFL